MRSHPGSVDVQREATSLLWTLSVNEACARLIGEVVDTTVVNYSLDLQLGGIQDILAALRDNFEEAVLAKAACGALWSLAVCG